MPVCIIAWLCTCISSCSLAVYYLNICISSLRRSDEGQLVSEEDMSTKHGISATRIQKIIRHCLATGSWQFDEYEPELVLYRVILDRKFASSRNADCFCFAIIQKFEEPLRHCFVCCGWPCANGFVGLKQQKLRSLSMSMRTMWPPCSSIWCRCFLVPQS